MYIPAMRLCNAKRRELWGSAQASIKILTKSVTWGEGCQKWPILLLCNMCAAPMFIFLSQENVHSRVNMKDVTKNSHVLGTGRNIT